MNKIAKILSFFAIIGGAAAAGVVLAKNGKFDGIINKIKGMRDSWESGKGNILEEGVCMIAEASDDDENAEKSASGRKSQKSYEENDLKAEPNGRH